MILCFVALQTFTLSACPQFAKEKLPLMFEAGSILQFVMLEAQALEGSTLGTKSKQL